MFGNGGEKAKKAWSINHNTLEWSGDDGIALARLALR